MLLRRKAVLRSARSFTSALNIRQLGLLAAAAVGGIVIATAGPAAAARVPSATVRITTRTSGVFDGIGAILGGGGNARLLADYPPAVRDEIYNYLFRPATARRCRCSSWRSAPAPTPPTAPSPASSPRPARSTATSATNGRSPRRPSSAIRPSSCRPAVGRARLGRQGYLDAGRRRLCHHLAQVRPPASPAHLLHRRMERARPRP